MIPLGKGSALESSCDWNTFLSVAVKLALAAYSLMCVWFWLWWLAQRSKATEMCWKLRCALWVDYRGGRLAAFFVWGSHSAAGPVPPLYIFLLLNWPPLYPGNPPACTCSQKELRRVCLQAWLALITLPVDIHATFSSHSAVRGVYISLRKWETFPPRSHFQQYNICTLQCVSAASQQLFWECMDKVLVYIHKDGYVSIQTGACISNVCELKRGRLERGVLVQRWCESGVCVGWLRWTPAGVVVGGSGGRRCWSWVCATLRLTAEQLCVGGSSCHQDHFPRLSLKRWG